DGFADEAFAFAELYADFFQAAKQYLERGGEEHPLDWTQLHQRFVAQFEGRLEAFLALRGADLEGFRAALECAHDDAEADVMVELMLSMSDYQPWLKSMLALADERQKDHDESAPSLQDGAESALLTPDLIEEVSSGARCQHRQTPWRWRRHAGGESLNVPWLPWLGEVQLVAQCSWLRSAVGRLKVPVYFYGAVREDQRPLAELRRHLGYFSGAAKGEWSGLPDVTKEAIARLPADRGPQVDERHGVTVVGAAPWVHNYNLLVTADLDQAELMARCRRIARGTSSRHGGPAEVETMALPHEKGVEAPEDERGDEAFFNKFSRQNAAFGAEVTMKMTKMKILVVGCSGVAVEIVKNLVLQGLGGVTLIDSKPAKIQDLGTNFFLSEADIGKPLDTLLVPKFQELNPFCDIRTASELNAEVVQQHSALLICESMPLPTLLQWNEYCRNLQPKPVAFLYVRTGGVFGNVFVDFGPSHILADANGQASRVQNDQVMAGN
ncbi:unnamed protein product, partial [Effrenium voratum]